MRYRNYQRYTLLVSAIIIVIIIWFNYYYFRGILKCNRCNYRSSCERAMFQHSVNECSGIESNISTALSNDVPDDFFCICGYSTGSGNSMAHHLVICGYKSAYSSIELAQDNTVKRNMLDMLGLVKKNGESLEVSTSTDVASTVSTSSVEQTPQKDENLEIYEALQRETTTQQSQQNFESSENLVVTENTAHSAVIYEPENVNQHLESLGPSLASLPLAPSMPLETQLQSTAPLEVAVSLPVVQTLQNYNTIPQSALAASGHYDLGYGQTADHVGVTAHALHAENIVGMPLIGSLADPHPPNTSQFLGEGHTPTFEVTTDTEQQHYHQMM